MAEMTPDQLRERDEARKSAAGMDAMLTERASEITAILRERDDARSAASLAQTHVEALQKELAEARDDTIIPELRQILKLEGNQLLTVATWNLMKELTTLRQALRESEAAVARMREAIESAKMQDHTLGGEHSGHSEDACGLCDMLNQALSPTSGKEFVEYVEGLEKALDSIVKVVECEHTLDCECPLCSVNDIAREALAKRKDL
jgi:hypothetical protein